MRRALLCTSWAQATNEQLAAHGAELDAGIGCQKGRYAQGIKALEDLLNRNRIPYPPMAGG